MRQNNSNFEMSDRVNISLGALSRFVFVSIVGLQFMFLAFPSTAKSGAVMDDFERSIIDVVYDSTELDMVHCLFSIKRNSFVEGDLEKSSIDSVSVRLLLTTPAKGMFPTVIYVYQADGSKRHGQVTFFAQRFDSVLTVGRSIKRGASAHASKPSIDFRDVTNIIGSPLTSLSQLDGNQFRKTARVNAILTEEMLERVPEVEVGDQVLISYKRGGLVMSARGKSLGRGVIGESIRVRNVSSKKIISATITGNGIVTLQALGAGSR